MTTPDLEMRLKAALSTQGGASSDYDLNADVRMPTDRKLAPASVLIAIRAQTGQIVLTKRSARLKHHPGQIAFAGGRQDPEDADAIAAALREAEEEIGLSRDQVRVLGTLPPHETVTRYQITPVLALVDGPFTPVPEAREVSEVFEVPFDYVTTQANFQIQSRQWQGRARHYFTVTYGPYYIWGATARILRSLADRLQP